MNSYLHPRFKRTSLRLLLCLLLLSGAAGAQDGGKIWLDREKDQWVSVSGSMQFWLRYAQLNPGSLVHQQEQQDVWDVSIRRYRLKLSGKASDQLRFFFELGNNDVNPYSGNGSLPHVLDAYADYQLNQHFGFGIGKQAWTGLARFAAPGTTQALGYDIDFVAAPFVNVHDDIMRRLGIYARGTYGGFDYRLSLAKPSFTPSSLKVAPTPTAQFSDRQPPYQFSAYVKHQFLEKEAQNTSFSPGTYLGKKNILNLGIGTLYQPQTSWSLLEQDTVYHAAKSWAADLFFDRSLRKNRAFTTYLAFINHQFGPRFMRYMGANNPATGNLPTDWINGRGNNAPVIGSGHLWYLQVAYLRPLTAENKQQLQLYATLQLGRYEALQDPVLIYHSGISYLLNGQRAKLTLGYHNRSVFRKVEQLARQEMRRSTLVMQYQILFGG